MNNRTAMSYDSAHRLVKKHHGNAREHLCIDCGEPARQWSYDHTDTNEIVDARGREYSCEPQRYQPRCVSCHLRFDAKHRRSGVPHLHAVALELEPQIREAVYQRRQALKRYDMAAVEEWDDELELLTAPLKTAHTPTLAKRIKLSS